MRKMEVVGVRVEMPTNQPIVLLKETEGDRYLPISMVGSGGGYRHRLRSAGHGPGPAAHP